MLRTKFAGYAIAALIGVRLVGGIELFAAAAEDRPSEDTAPLLMVRSKGKYGLIDRVGKLVLKPQYESLYGYDSSQSFYPPYYLQLGFSEGMRPAQLEQAWGYIDNSGKEIIPFQFSMAGPFQNGRAQVRVGELWGIINREGGFIVEPKYSFIGPFCDGLARVAVGGTRLEGGNPNSKWGYINEKGEEVVRPIYDYTHDFLNGRGLVNVGGKWKGEAGLSFREGLWGIVDETGDFIVEPKILLDKPQPLVSHLPPDDGELIPFNFDGKYGFRDQRWNFVVQPRFEAVLPFSEGLAAVRQAGKFGYIDSTGNWKIEPEFLAADQFSEGLGPVQTTEGIAFIDKNGKRVLEVDGDEAKPFKGEIAAVKNGNLWGIIDKHGRFIHEPQFAEVRPHGDEFYSIETPNRLRGLMDLKGQVIVPPEYGAIGGFQKNGFAMLISETEDLPQDFWLTDKKGRLVPGPMTPFEAADPKKKIAFLPKRVDRAWGIVALNGKFVVEPRYSDVKVLAPGILGIQERMKWGMFDLDTGSVIAEPTYYSIDKFSEGLAAARPNRSTFPPGDGNWFGYIDLKGQLVIPNKFASGSQFKNGIARVGVLYQGDMDHYYIDKQGNFLWYPEEE